jgi:hypothetical protein
MAIGFCSPFFGSIFFLQILRLEKKPWRKTGQSRDKAETKQQVWKKAMGKEAWKKASASKVELSGRIVSNPTWLCETTILHKLDFVKAEFFPNLTL